MFTLLKSPMLVFLILSTLTRISQASDYCSLCPNGIHTMCLYPEGPSPKCLDYKKVEINDHTKQYIVDVHNDIRNHVASGLETKGKLGKQPAAANMMKLKWDDELGLIAQRWADQCKSVNDTLQHDLCKKTDDFEHVGQNILTVVTNTTDLPELAILILNWYRQVSNVIPTDVDYFSGLKRGKFLIGQYTQLVWAKTRYVGCGISIYKEPGSNYYDQRFICNYAPGGNILGQPIYLTGEPCSKCPKGRCDSVRDALCEENSIQSWKVKTKSQRKIEQWLKKRDTLCIRLPEDDSQGTISDCMKIDNKTEEIDAVIFKNSFSEENHKVYEAFPDDISGVENLKTEVIQSQFVLNLTTLGELIKNLNYTNLIQNIKLVPELEPELLEESDNLNTSKTVRRVKRAMGKWYNGRCHCDVIYRERSNGKKYFFHRSGFSRIRAPYIPIAFLSIIICIFTQ